MKEEIEDILMNSYDKFGNFDEPKATKKLLNLFSVSYYGETLYNTKHEALQSAVLLLIYNIESNNCEA